MHQVSAGGLYKLSSVIFFELPDLMEKRPDFKELRFRSNDMEALRPALYDSEPSDGNEYIQLLGHDEKSNRVYKYFRRDFLRPVESLDKWKVIVPAANGSGAIGEVLSTPVIGTPVIGHTQSFLSIGCFDTEAEALVCLKYIKSKFARAMLGVLKTTQNGKAKVWKYVPLQDFTPNSDIDWTQSVAQIDQQLYRKYGLDEAEIEFIETRVKAME
jgi:type II restriction enzyme